MRTKTKLALIGTAVIVILVILMARNRAALNAQHEGGSMSTAISVSTITAVRQSINDNISVVGTVNAMNDVVVLSETQGRVVKINAEVGEFKPAGSVLVEVDSELKVAAYKAAEVTYEKAKKDLERYESLFKEHSISDSQIEQARWNYQTAESQYIVARRQLNDTKITTPISGYVTARMVNVGTMVMGAPQATQIADIVDLSRVKVKVSVAERDLGKLRVGDAAEVTSELFPHTTFTGTVFSVSAKGDEGHTYPVEVLLSNPKLDLKAGMFVTVTFKPKSSAPALVIPRAALVGSLQDAKLFVVKDNVAKLRSVTAVREIGTSVEISSGLEEGEMVVIDGQDNLSDNVAVVVRK
ncbi:MAG TPA: efflux RND transporter periplasmic adaptor subunit [Bacteroidota bacterium]|nr:efflux RND transporter periplasmic adaptor subunit [Bacteroidota bacterium]